MSIGIATLAFAGIITGYVQSSSRAEWSGYSLAAQALAIQQLEQAKSAKWDVLDTPVVDEIMNIPTLVASQLDLPVSGTNQVWATNYTTISSVVISANPAISVHMVRVDTVWPFRWYSTTRYFTNTLVDYFAPD